MCIDRPILSLDRPFTYDLPAELDAGVGSLVSVRFHGKLTRGWVLGPTEDIPSRMLKVHKLVSPVRFFDERMLELLQWVGERYVAPLATVITRSHPPRVAGEELEPARPATALRSTRPTPSQPGTDPARSEVASPRAAPAIATYRKGTELLTAIERGSGGTFRLRPVPEDEQLLAVEAVGACLEAGRRAVVIVAEAEPVPATARAIAKAFGDRVALFLGGDKRERYRMWLDIKAGNYEVVIGTKPAVFAPIADLGLIWLSRESHAGHREERSPSWHVRDVARVRAEIEGAPFVMEALCHSAEGHVMDAVDVAPATRAWVPVEVVRPGPEGRAPRLVAALKEARRAFLFEPLPGYGVARVCRSCGEPAACAECGGVLRASGGAVRCIVCEAEGRCANCGSTDFGVARGGAERVEEWASRIAPVPVRRTELPAGDGVGVGGPEAVKDVDPPGLQLVGILDADLAARRPGLSAMERALAVWMEAGGWARPGGRVIVQSRRAGDPTIQSLVQGNPARYFRAEVKRRADAGFPVGHPVFRVVGRGELGDALRATEPTHLLETSLGDETVCLLTVRPDGVAKVGRTLRDLAASGVVVRVEAEPHL